jgi:hypothetical protein
MISGCCILLGVWLATLGLLLGAVRLRNWRIDRQRSRMPVAEKLLRGPGESLRKKLEEVEDQISEKLATAFVLPLLCTSTVLLQPHPTLLGPASVGAAVVGIPTFFFLCHRLWRLQDQRRNYRLGLSGERAVGEELNQLMLIGCRVFHDVPNNPYGNVDHVLVAPSGVYAVETKARRKKESAGRGAHKVTFDGRSLRFADGPPESRCLDQAKQQASRLSDWLSKAVGDSVDVQPVLALPGWFVERQGRGNVIVVSGRAVKTLVKGRPVLDPAKIERIAHQLDQRCRDVES